MVHPDVSELVGHSRDDAAGGGKVHGHRSQMLPFQCQRVLHRAPVVEVARRQVRLQLGEDRRVERRPARHRQPRPQHQVADVLDTALHAPEVPKRRLDAVEQRLETLDRVRLGEVRVGERQRRHQVLHLARHAGDVDPRLAEVDLHRGAGDADSACRSKTAFFAIATT